MSTFDRNTLNYVIGILLWIAAITAIAMSFSGNVPTVTADTVAAAPQARVQDVSPTTVPTTYIHTWTPKDDMPVLLCIAVDTFPYPGGVHDTMRACGDGTAVDREREDKPAVSTPSIVDDEPVDNVPALDEPVDNDTPKVDKPKGNNGNHYGNDKPDNNPKDSKNKHDGSDNIHPDGGKPDTDKTNNGNGKGNN